jgi:hypothetical protein
LAYRAASAELKNMRRILVVTGLSVAVMAGSQTASYGRTLVQSAAASAKIKADALAKAQALAAATKNAASAGKKRAEEAKRITLITKRSFEAEISRKNEAARKAAQAQFNIASRTPLSLRPAYPKHKTNKAAAWAARVAHGGGLATGLRAEESRERLRAAMRRWRLRRAERRLTN